MRKKITLDDIAADTGLSKYAVSRAIAGKSGVSNETREIILSSCKKLGYVKKPGVKTGSYILLLIRKSDVDDPAFWMPVIQGVESAASKNGYLLHIKLLHTIADELTTIELANAAGIIYAGYRSTEWIQAEYDRPSVLVSYPPRPMFAMDCLYCADVESGSEMTQKLIDWHHTKIAYCGNGERASALNRLIGIRQALTQNGLELYAHYKMDELNDVEHLATTFKQLIRKKELPTAYLCETEIVASIIQRVAGLLSIPVPNDISIVTFNHELQSRHHNSFTGMALDKIEYGKEAVRLLLERINNPDKPFSRLVIRHTYVNSFSAAECRAINNDNNK